MTKPCERTPCPGLIKRDSLTPSQYAKRKYCSCRCAMLARVANGWKPPTLTYEQRAEIGRDGGLQAGENRRRRAAQRIAGQLERYITPAMEAALSHSDLLRLKVLFARAYADGHTAGRSCARVGRTGNKAAA